MSDTQIVQVQRTDAPEEVFDLGDAITPQTPPEVVLTVLDKVALLKERMKALNEWADAALTEWIHHNGPLTNGTLKWWVGDVSEIEWLDIPGAAEAGLIAAGGDWAAFVRDFLVSKPVKHGALEQAIGAEAAAKFFRRRKVEELRDNAATVKKKLQRTDLRYVR